MNPRSIFLILCPLALLLLTAHRLPAPISEVREKPIKIPAKKDVGLTASETSEIAAKLKELGNKWEASFATHDSLVVKSLLADNFVGVWFNGKVLNKEGYLDELRSDANIYEFTVNESADVHIYSRTMAVVTGTSRTKGKTKSGTHFDNVWRFTSTWTERNGVWRCTADQFVLVSPR